MHRPFAAKMHRPFVANLHHQQSLGDSAVGYDVLFAGKSGPSFPVAGWVSR
jgi:hypothetical protein